MMKNAFRWLNECIAKYSLLDNFVSRIVQELEKNREV